jgi:hypothetical protein
LWIKKSASPSWGREVKEDPNISRVPVLIFELVIKKEFLQS